MPPTRRRAAWVALFVIVQPLMQGGYAAGQRGAGAIRAAHGLNGFVFLGVVAVHIDVSHASGHALIEHFYEVINHLVLIHIFLFPAWAESGTGQTPATILHLGWSRCPQDLFAQIQFDITGEHLVFLTQSAGNDGEGIGDTVLRIIERQLGYG